MTGDGTGFTLPIVVSFGAVLVLSTLLAAQTPEGDSVVPASQPSSGFLTEILQAELLPEQLAILDGSHDPEAVIAVMSSDQKQVARLRLRHREANATAADLKEIARGYELLGVWDESLRVEAGTSRRKDRELAAASTALSQGKNDEAALLAAAILARDPLNEHANSILQLSKRYVPEAELEKIRANPTQPNDVKVLGYMLQAGNARGDHDKLLRLAMDAIRADPTSPLAHEFYNTVNEQRSAHVRRVREAYSYVQESKRALAKGDRQTAEVWATKAAQANPGPGAESYLLSIRQGKDERITPQPIATLAQQPKEGSPFWPLAGAAAAVLALGGAAVTFGDKAMAWAKDHPYLAVAGGAVVVGTAGWLVLGSATGGGLTLLTTTGLRAGTAVRAGAASKATVDGGITLLAAKGAADGLSGARKSAEPTSTSKPEGVPIGLPLPLGSSEADNCALKPGDDILLRFADGTRLAPGFLEKHEAAGGHTISTHIDKKAAYLVGRLPKKPGASSFPDQPVAEKVIRTTVMTEQAAISAWAAQPPPVEPKAFFYSGSEIIGYGVTREKPALPQNKTNARTVLHLMKDCRILILTAYPE